MWIYLDVKEPSHLKYISPIPTGIDEIGYLVGFFAPDGKFIWHFGYKDFQEAERQVHHLNGGGDYV